MRVIFMGTPDFSVAALDAITAAGHEVVAVYSQPPRPAGRGKAPRKSPVHVRAEALGIPVRTPATLKEPAEIAAMADFGADIAVVVAYGLLLPQAVLDVPAKGCLNIHASLLPRWRGAAPIQRAIMAGDQETGICIMQMDAGLDTGPVRLRAALPIAEDETAGTLHDKLADLGGDLIVAVLGDLDAHPPVPQIEAGVTYARKIEKSEAAIDWTAPAERVDRQIRGLAPFPGAWCLIGAERVKMHLSARAEGQGAPGAVIAAPLRVACGTGAVDILRLQRAGKSAAPVADVLRGFDIPVGTRLPVAEDQAARPKERT